MTTSAISQTGIQPNLINQMHEVPKQNQLKPDKDKNEAFKTTDTVQISFNISDKPAIESDAINEEDAIILAQLAAKDLAKEFYGMSTQAGTEALRNII